MDNPHVLVRYDVTGPADRFLSLVLSQYKKQNDVPYTLTCFSADPFELSKPEEDLKHKVKLSSAWTEGKSGGPIGSNTYKDNPSFAVYVPKDGAEIQVEVSTSQSSAVHVDMVPVSTFGDGMDRATGEYVIDSGNYRHGFLVTERERVAAGAYCLLISNFTPGMLGSFHVVVSSSVRIIVEEM